MQRPSSGRRGLQHPPPKEKIGAASDSPLKGFAMPRPGLLATWVLAGLALAFSRATTAGERRFQGPFAIEDVPLPVGLDAGDFNKDGKLDLVAASGSGPPQILLQDSSDRTSWSRSPLKGRNGGYFVRAADFDGDGQGDVAAA